MYCWFKMFSAENYVVQRFWQTTNTVIFWLQKDYNCFYKSNKIKKVCNKQFAHFFCKFFAYNAVSNRK